MKILVLLSSTLFLMACSFDKVIQTCSGPLNDFRCEDPALNAERDQNRRISEAIESNNRQDERISIHDKELNELREEIQRLEERIESQIGDMDFYGGKLFELEMKLEELKIQETENQELNNFRIANTEMQISELEIEISRLQDSVESILTDLAQVQENQSVAWAYDPCGDSPGYDEVLLKTHSGQYLAYYQKGSKRHLYLLEPGEYKTSDGSSCKFEVAACPTEELPKKTCIINEEY